MADLFSSADVDFGQCRVCNKCEIIKPLQEFAAGRARCRSCYNIGRRGHYAKPGVKDEKNRKRVEYMSRPEVREARKLWRSAPFVRQREREALRRYRSDPAIKERHRAYHSGRIQNPVVKARLVFLAARTRAEGKKLTFDLSEAWVMERISRGVCELTGLPFEYGRPQNGWRKHPYTPSIDRISSSGGYTKDNCRLVLTSVNIALGQWGLDVLMNIAEALTAKKRAG